MSSRTPIIGSGIVANLAAIWADISYAQLRVIELNRPRRAKTDR
jgi:hypothetical protein